MIWNWNWYLTLSRLWSNSQIFIPNKHVSTTILQLLHIRAKHDRGQFLRKIFAHLGNCLRQLLQKMYCNQSKNVLCNMQSLLRAEIQFYVSLYHLYKISKIGVRSWWGKESIVIFGDHLWSDKSIKDYKYISTTTEYSEWKIYS